MSRFKLDKKTTVEYTLFEKFAWFLAELNNPKKKLSVGEFQQYAANNLLDINITPGTIRNLFKDAGDYAEIEDYRFKFFCEKFESTFLELPTEQQVLNQEIYEAFNQWRKNIFLKQGWELPSSIANIDKPMLKTSNSSTDSTPELTKQFLNEIGKNYKSPFHEDNFYEAWAFRNWRDIVQAREKESKRAIMPELLRHLLSRFSRGGFDVFTIQKNKIAKKRLYFEAAKQNKSSEITGSFYSDNSQDLWIGKFLYNFEDDLLIIGNDRYSTPTGKELCAYVFKIPPKEGWFAGQYYSSPIDQCYGYFISFPNIKARELNIKFAACSFIYKEKDKDIEDVPEYSEHDLHDETVPFKMRAFIKESEDDYPKNLGHRFLYKALAHFFYYIGYTE